MILRKELLSPWSFNSEVWPSFGPLGWIVVRWFFFFGCLGCFSRFVWVGVDGLVL